MATGTLIWTLCLTVPEALKQLRRSIGLFMLQARDGKGVAIAMNLEAN